MKLIVDANILFAALIKNRCTADLIFNSKLELYTPEFIFEEFKKYEKLILTKTSRTKEEFEEIFSLFKEFIKVINFKDYSEKIDEAKNISPDEKDIAYIALALKLNCGVWSNDKILKNQEKVKIHSTSELVHMFFN
jgi:predicted nucleic acid-binding protein